jgi:hypothetical protein
METPGRPFREGDRVEWAGPIKGSRHYLWPQPGEQGWITDLSPFASIVWDETGTTTGWNVASDPDIALVDDRNEPDPSKRLPYDPAGPGGYWGASE